MNVKIAIGIICAFMITAILLVLALYFVPNISEINPNHPFFNKTFDSNKLKIIMLGSSHIGQSNSTYISENILQNFPRYEFYNLAISADKPKERLELLDRTVRLKPSIIFYGISYRDFTENNNQNSAISILPIYSNLIKEIDPENKLDNFNPAVIRIYGINIVKDVLGLQSQNQYNSILNEHTPFFPQSIEDKFASKIDLERHVHKLQPPNIDSLTNDQIDAFKNIINNLQENNVKVVIFTTPLSKQYTEKLSDQTKSNFQQILQNIESEYNVKVYNFTYNYQKLSIWKDSQHVLRNPSAVVYSNDITNMIMSEIEP